MSPQTFPSDDSHLVPRVLAYFTKVRGLAYAQIAPDLTIQRASPSLRPLLREPGDVEGQLLTDLLWEFVGSEKAIQAILTGELPAFRLDRVNRDDLGEGISYWNFHLLPLDAANPARGLLLIVENSTHSSRLEQELLQDRNERRLVQARLAQANEELHRLNQYKSFLLSMASHDLRSSLTTILGYADLLLEDLGGLSAEEQISFLKTIRVHADWIHALIISLLDLERIERGKLPLQLLPCDLNSLVSNVVYLTQAMASLRGLELTMEAVSTPLVVRGDPERIQQILHNLLGNAVKYTPSGGKVHCTLAARWTATPPEAVISIEDTGMGLSKDQQAYLFTPYYRTEEAHRSAVTGVGLGLYIVKTLVEAHGGRIEVYSEARQGSTFQLYFPLIKDVGGSSDA